MKTRLFLSALIIFVLSSCGNDYYTSSDYADAKKIDSHVHVNSESHFFEKQAIKENCKLITINVDIADSMSVINQLKNALVSKQKYPHDFFYAATFYFDTTGWDSEKWSTDVISHLEKNISGGAVSVKLWKNIGMTVRDRNSKFIMVDDPKIDPVIDYIVSRGLPITGHLGEPRNCWLPLSEMTIKADSEYFATYPQYHMFLHPEFPTYEQQISALNHMLEKHPDLKFIACHLGSVEWSVDELAKTLDRFPNMAVDLAARVCHLEYQSLNNNKKVRDFCIKYQDRLIYGTDIVDNGITDEAKLDKVMHETWQDDWNYFATDDEMTSATFKGKFQALHLPKEVVNKIFNDNAIKWYKLSDNIK